MREVIGSADLHFLYDTSGKIRMKTKHGERIRAIGLEKA